ncbi:MAG TPA: (d)CMP kinase [Dehalococcoidia bacterium]|nr:(d)CMP kinase [Dehalococcoidia bacterium]
MENSPRPSPPASTKSQEKFDGTIAIDGPSAAGKSTVGKEVARRLGHPFLDTGAMYRAITWAALQHSVDLEDDEALGEMAHSLELKVGPAKPDSNEACTIWLDGQEITDKLRLPEVEAAVSLVSRIPMVREALVKLQRQLAASQPVVMAGRDIGTVVLPDADLKIYLEASLDERAMRRYKELQALGRTVSLAEVSHDLARRDRIDSERKVSPLQPATDAIIIDTNDLTLEEVVEKVMELINGRPS